MEIKLDNKWREFFRANELVYMRRVDSFFATRPAEERRRFEATVDALNRFLAELPAEEAVADIAEEGMKK